MEKNKSKQLYNFRYFIYILCLIFVFFIYNEYINSEQIDFCVHVYNNGISTGKIKPFDLYSHNLFQLLLYFAYRIVRIPLKESAIIILLLFEAIRLFFIDHILSKRCNDWVMPLMNCSLLFIMPIIGLRSGVVYLGKTAGNIWHNTSYSALVPFSIMTLYYFKSSYLDGNFTKKNLLMLTISMFLSIVAKPSFMIAFLPSCFIFLIYEAIKKRQYKEFIKKISTGILVSLPCIIYLLLELFFTYHSKNSNSSIVIAPFEVWSIYSKNILKSFVLGNAFGLCYVFCGKKWKDNDFIFMMLLLASGFLIYSLFAEEGPQFGDGNFGWTYNVCGLMFQTYCAIDLFLHKNLLKNKKIYFYSCYFVYCVHLISGLIYIYQITNHLISI